MHGGGHDRDIQQGEDTREKSKLRRVREQQNALYESMMGPGVLGMSRPGKFDRIASGVLDWNYL